MRQQPFEGCPIVTDHYMCSVYIKTNRETICKETQVGLEYIIHTPINSWEKYVWNEINGKWHNVEVSDSRNGIFCITTIMRHGHGCNHAQIIDIIKKWTCTCSKFKQRKFPCSHTMVACFNCCLNPIDLVENEHSFHAYQATFSLQFYHLRDQNYWLVLELKLTINSSRLKQTQPRPLRIARIRNEIDRRCPDTPRHYSNCLHLGHTAPNSPFARFFHW